MRVIGNEIDTKDTFEVDRVDMDVEVQQTGSGVVYLYLTLYYIDTHFNTSTTDSF